MKRLKISFAALAVVLGLGSAFATTTYHPFSNKTWGLNQATGLYIDVTGQTKGVDYSCASSTKICTEDYPSDVNPNDQDHDAHPGTVQGTNIVLGNFSN